MLEENNLVRIIKYNSEYNIPAGSVGTILMVYTFPRIAYEVEFINNDGDSLAVLTLEEIDVEKF